MILIGSALMTACGNDGGEGGVVNDGFKGGADPNGGLPDTMQHMDPAIDSSRGEDRVDTEKRDTVPR